MSGKQQNTGRYRRILPLALLTLCLLGVSAAQAQVCPTTKEMQQQRLEELRQLKLTWLRQAAVGQPQPTPPADGSSPSPTPPTGSSPPPAPPTGGSCGPSNAKVFYENDFSNGFGNFYKFDYKCRPDQFSVVNGVFRAFQEGDKQCPEMRPDVLKGRTLIKFRPKFETGVETWAGFRMFIPNDYPADGIALPFQLIGSGGPEMHAVLKNRTINIVKETTAKNGTILQSGGISSFGVPDGKWVDFVLHYKRSAGSDGIFELYMDGKRVVNNPGPNIRNHDWPGVQLHVGVYLGKHKYPGKDFELFFDDVRIAEGKDGYSAVSPSCN